MYLQKLIAHCEKYELPLVITYLPDNSPEQWDIIVHVDEGHFYSAYDTIEKAANKILDEMEIG